MMRNKDTLTILQSGNVFILLLEMQSRTQSTAVIHNRTYGEGQLISVPSIASYNF